LQLQLPLSLCGGGRRLDVALAGLDDAAVISVLSGFRCTDDFSFCIEVDLLTASGTGSSPVVVTAAAFSSLRGGIGADVADLAVAIAGP